MPDWLESTCTAAGAAVLSLWCLLMAACGLAGVRSGVRRGVAAARFWRGRGRVVAAAERMTREGVTQ